jgi:DNA helicase-2/ATP-dependent DNA helicase PcrA
MEEELKSAGSEDRAELANVQELVTSAAEFDREHPGAAPEEYLNQVALVSDVDRFEGGDGAVTLMTLHAAKGLEFPAVIMVGCEEGLLPFHRSAESAAQAEEERRLCFVGMTRAQHHLALTHALFRGLRGARVRQMPSKFLAELAGEHVTRVDLSEDIEPAHPRGRQRFDDGRSAGQARQGTGAAGDGDFFDADAATDSDDGDAIAAGGLRPGRRVRHAKFGRGRVAQVGRSGAYIRAVVDFDEYGRKTLILQFAHLELL